MTPPHWNSRFDNIGRRLFIATHRRSGTHLTIDLLRKQFIEFRSWKRLGERADRLYLTLEHLARVGLMGVNQTKRALTIDQAIDILQRPRRPIVKTHSRPEFADWTEELRGFVDRLLDDADIIYVYRDARSVMESLHLYMQFFHEDARCPLGEFIRQEIDGVSHVQAWAEHVRQWLAVPGVIPLRFEDVIRDTRTQLARLGDVLHSEPLYVEPLLPRRLRSVWESRWLRFTSRRPEPSTILGDGYNRRTKINWREALTRADREFFHEHAGEMLIRLGYEPSDDWVDEAARRHPASSGT